MRERRRPSPATVIACLALFFAIAGGSAIALQGRNTVDSGDIKPKAVKTSDIANNAVTTNKIKNNHVRATDIQNNAVGTGEIRNGQVRAADLAAQGAYRVVGAASQPPFNTGTENDCIWSGAASPPLQLNPASFYKDAMGRVYLAGVTSSANGPGGDATCGPVGPEAGEDAVAFVLPPAYQPANDEIRPNPAGGGGTLLIVGSTPLDLGPGGIVPAGALLDLTDEGVMLLDGIDFRAAGTGSGFTRRGPRGVGDLPDNIADLLD